MALALEARENIFEHILYEMSMFLYTKIYMSTQGDSAVRNMAVESHSLHLRNLIEFFGKRNSNYITSAAVLLNTDGLSLDTKVELANGMDAFAIPSQITNHLSFYRCSVDAYTKTNTIIKGMFPRVAINIIEFVKLISISENVVPKYREQLNSCIVATLITAIEKNHQIICNLGILKDE